MPTCNGTNPKELIWLQQKIAELNGDEFMRPYSFITEARYRGEVVFVIRICCPMCLTTPPPVYNCAGVELFDESDERFERLKDEKLYWVSEDYVCTF